MIDATWRGLTTAVVGVIICAAPAAAQDAYRATPFAIEQIFGSRPVIDASLNGQPYRMIVHANAGSYVQVNHAEAARLNIAGMVRQGAYGITAPGQVSALGREEGVLQTLDVAGLRRENVPVAVFERVSARSEGMLGLAWLRANQVIIDYARNQVILPRDQGETDRYSADLTARGYQAHVLRRDPEDNRYTVGASIGGRPVTLVVSTVAGNVLDAVAADEAGVRLGRVTGRWGGPGGAVGETRSAARAVTVGIGEWRSPPTRFSVYDTYAYSGTPRPYLAASGRGGDLGADFLIANRAVVDFGSGRLWLKASGF